MPSPEYELWGARIRYTAELSRRYHVARSAFLSFWHNAIQLLVAAYGASAFVALFPDAPVGNSWIYGLFGAVVAGLTLVDLIYRLSERAGDHSFLARQFSDILRDLYSADVDEGRLQRLQEKLDEVNASEPLPVYVYVEAECHNEIMRAYAFEDDYKVDLRTLARLFKHITNWGAPLLRAKKGIESDRNYYIQRMSVPLRLNKTTSKRLA